MAAIDHLESALISLVLIISNILSVLISLVAFVVTFISEKINPTKPLNFSSVLVTGASAGIGKSLALRYSKPGVFIALTGRNKERLEETKKLCENKGATVEITTIDVSDTEKFSKWLTDLDAKHPFDLVFANAGVSGSSLGYERTFESKAREMFSINVDGVLNTILPILPQIRERRRGHIVVLSSMAGLFAPTNSAAYASTKAALFTFCQHTQENLRHCNVRLSVVCPGYVESGMTDARRKLGGSMPFFLPTEVAIDKIAAGIDANRFLIAFPLPLYLTSWVFRSLPAAATQLAYRVVNPKTTEWNKIG